MAVQNYSQTGLQLIGATWAFTWTLANGDTGQPAPIDNALGPWLASVVSGTLGVGGSVTFQGSVDGGTTWFTLNDDTGAALTMTALNVNKPVKERPLLVRPSCTAGDGTTSIKCTLVVRK